MKLSSKRSARVEKSLNYLCKTVNYPFLARVLLARREYVRLSQRFAEKEDFSVPTLGAIIGLCQAAKCDCRALRPRACRGALRLVLPSQCGIVMEKTSPLTSHRISQVKYQLSSRARSSKPQTVGEATANESCHFWAKERSIGRSKSLEGNPLANQLSLHPIAAFSLK